MSLYPSAPDIFVDRTGADNIASSDPNNAYDAIENIENFLGASGQPQSKSVTLVNLFRAMFLPIPQCSWIDADTIGILPTQAVLYATDNFVIKRNTDILTCCLSLHLDAGSELASSWYDLYLVGDGNNSQYTAKFVLQGSSPSGLTYYKRINSFRNNASSNLIRSLQAGNYMRWDPVQLASAVNATNFTDLNFSAQVPRISKLVEMIVDLNTAGTIRFRTNGSVAATSALQTNQFSSSVKFGSTREVLDDLGLLEYSVDAGAASVYAAGYYLTEIS